ncbi:hypothetical protein [Sorangium sp. So ce1000]|uniref:hypothetical protein n=1 Tax=Sorangium sp. So ce1000 TaxID=3133325 RepID=UPI003F629806
MRRIMYAGLARRMYESRVFGPMPLLADALLEAGCDEADVMAHCRGQGPQVRGCWVIDLANPGVPWSGDRHRPGVLARASAAPDVLAGVAVL